MGKVVADSVLDAALDKIGTSNRMNANSAEPADKTAADTTLMLANVVMAGGDFTNANGDTSGRKVTVAAKNGVSVTNSGVANHVSLTDATELLYVTTVATPPTLNAGGTVNFGTWKVEILDPT